jgi:hypothetical protein
LCNPNAPDRDRLEIDPLPRSIAGPLAGPVELSMGTSATPDEERWPGPAATPAITSLGQIRTDDVGRLIVVPGAGIASRGPDANDIDTYANNDNWFDDVADGPISATVALRAPDGTVTEHPAEGAWLLVGPDFGSVLPQVVSLYDIVFDLAVRQLTIPTDESIYQTGELARLTGLQKLPNSEDRWRWTTLPDGMHLACFCHRGAVASLP